jgi:hypothetical protein
MGTAPYDTSAKSSTAPATPVCRSTDYYEQLSAPHKTTVSTQCSSMLHAIQKQLDISPSHTNNTATNPTAELHLSSPAVTGGLGIIHPRTAQLTKALNTLLRLAHGRHPANSAIFEQQIASRIPTMHPAAPPDGAYADADQELLSTYEALRIIRNAGILLHASDAYRAAIELHVTIHAPHTPVSVLNTFNTDRGHPKDHRPTTSTHRGARFPTIHTNTERWPRRAIAQELTFQDWRALEGAIEPARKRLLHIHSNDLRPLYDVQADFLVVMDASQKIPDDGGALRRDHGVCAMISDVRDMRRCMCRCHFLL